MPTSIQPIRIRDFRRRYGITKRLRSLANVLIPDFRRGSTTKEPTRVNMNTGLYHRHRSVVAGEVAGKRRPVTTERSVPDTNNTHTGRCGDTATHGGSDRHRFTATRRTAEGHVYLKAIWRRMVRWQTAANIRSGRFFYFAAPRKSRCVWRDLEMYRNYILRRRAAPV